MFSKWQDEDGRIETIWGGSVGPLRDFVERFFLAHPMHFISARCPSCQKAEAAKKAASTIESWFADTEDGLYQ